MGIVNVTPDSFSDGGRYLDPTAAVDHGLKLAAEGAALLDVGGESTRPGAEPVEPREQLRRVLPVVEALAAQAGIPVSIDTSSAVVAREALAAGAELINDVTALEADPEMLPVVVESGCGVCLMHMRGTPRTMQRDPQYDDVLADVARYLRQRAAVLERAAIDPRRVALDPGIGFGKTLEHNLELIRHADRFHALDRPLLYGFSRKRFIGEILGDAERDRDAASVGVALALAARGVQVLRMHRVGPVADALKLWRACGG